MIGAKEARALVSSVLEERFLQSSCEAWMEDILDRKIRKLSQNGFSSFRAQVPYEYKDHCTFILNDLGYHVSALGHDYNNDRKVLNLYISW